MPGFPGTTCSRCHRRPIPDPTTGPEEKRAALAQRYGDQAVERLQQAIIKGYKNAEGLKKATAFVPLQCRADFQKLLRDLDAKQKETSARN